MATRSVPKMYTKAPLSRRQVRQVRTDAEAPSVAWRQTAEGIGRAIKSQAQAAPDLDTVRSRMPAVDAPKLGDILTAEQNSFGVLRFLLAAAVLVSHAFYLYFGRVSSEPLYSVTGYTLGQHAVQVFFFLSGVLVAQSLAQSASLRDYLTARVLRIFPALIVCVLVTAYGLGPWLSTLGREAYLGDPGVISYVLKTMSLSTGSATLPGLYEANTVPGAVNTSLWTLKYEVICYALLAGIGAVAFLSGRTVAVVGATALAWFALMLTWRPELVPGATIVTVLGYFSLFFGAGAVAYLLRDQIRLHGAIVIALGAFAAYALKTTFAEIAMALFLGYGALWLGTFRFGGWRAFANTSDYSYGVYIYSMPVTQTLLVLQPDINLASLILAAFALTIVAAFLSWELIERPALALRHKFKRVTPEGRAQSELQAAPSAVQAEAGIPGRLPRARKDIQTSTGTALPAETDTPTEPTQPAVSGDRLRLAVRKPVTAARLSDTEREALLNRLKARGLAAAAAR